MASVWLPARGHTTHTPPRRPCDATRATRRVHRAQGPATPSAHPACSQRMALDMESLLLLLLFKRLSCDYYVDDDVVNENGILQNTIITKYDITVLRNFVVQGHIRSHKDVKIDTNVVVHGNIFAEGNIFIGKNAKVLGVVFTQENIYVDDGAIIGQPNKIKSVVARGNIELGHNCKVYGYIGTEGIGRICPEILG